MDGNDVSGALSKMLEDPAALAKAMSLASSLMGNMPSQNTDGKPITDAPSQSADESAAAVSHDTASEGNGEAPSIAAIAEMLGGGTKGDPRCALLYALKPYMGHGRAEKIDTLVNMLRLADLAGGMLGGKLF